MSAEGKKKRGIAGVANAKANPWRMNGWLPDWQARKLGCHHIPGAASGGSTFMRGMIGGVLAEKMGHTLHGNRYEPMLAHAQARCTDRIFAESPDYSEAAE